MPLILNPFCAAWKLAHLRPAEPRHEYDPRDPENREAINYFQSLPHYTAEETHLQTQVDNGEWVDGLGTKEIE
jgi:hypothetical protein